MLSTGYWESFFLLTLQEGKAKERGQAITTVKAIDSGQLLAMPGCSWHCLVYWGNLSLLLLLLPVWRIGAASQKSAKSLVLLLLPADHSSGTAKLCSAHTAAEV